jgi:large subunit ribosomal protein L23
VHPEANKIAIRQAVEQLFGVKVTGVWTAQQRGKAKRMGRSAGRRNHWKKAIVKLREGDTIESFGFEG